MYFIIIIIIIITFISGSKAHIKSLWSRKNEKKKKKEEEKSNIIHSYNIFKTQLWGVSECL